MFHLKKKAKKKSDEDEDDDNCDYRDNDVNIETYNQYSTSGSTALSPLLAASVEFQKPYGRELFWIDW